MNDVVACVVAHNRATLLPGVLSSLTRQLAPENVLVIDNASTDGTADVVRAFKGVRYFSTGANLGGAGGFAWAIELACALGYRYAYLLDDDAVPQPEAVRRVRDAAVRLIEQDDLAFVVSEPVAPDGRSEPVGMPVPAKSWHRHRQAGLVGAVAVEYAAFLGILVSLDVARLHALPYPEFFIWCDDLEYTRRISKERGGACLPASAIEHESAAMEAAGNRSLGWKYFYLVRNRLWLARWGLPAADRGHRFASVMMALTATKDEVKSRGLRPDLVRIVAKAWFEGLLRPRPAPHPVGSLLLRSGHASRWIADQRSAQSDAPCAPVHAP